MHISDTVENYIASYLSKSLFIIGLISYNFSRMECMHELNNSNYDCASNPVIRLHIAKFASHLHCPKL